MSDVGQLERKVQDRVIALFQKVLDYEYLGNWEYKDGNSNVEEDLLRAWLKSQGHNSSMIEKVLTILGKARAVGGGRSLYEANRDVYTLLRYGVKVSPGPGEAKVTISLIDWDGPHNNNFGIAEEVAIAGHHNKRPDLVLYVNGIALGVIELKRSLVSVTEGIRQNIGNQKGEFIRPFYSTVQLLFAGNDVEGLRYAVIETPEKYWLGWREESDLDLGPLDTSFLQLCSPERFLEIIHDFIVFDAGVKKTCRHNQYFGVKAAQKRVEAREGGIIWHTQGSGKSLTMVWLAKWIREHQSHARVLLITDRTELDDQIEGVFLGVNEKIYRTKSGSDLIAQLNTDGEWLLCSLVHKFGSSDENESSDRYIEDIKANLPKGFSAKGNFFVLVDECHRTQSGKMHDAMKEILPDAMFIGFTGTPLLKVDKRRTIETFGSYIHTYKFDEAVRDKVVLDLRYEARDIDQELTSQQKIDKWFEAKTKGLTDLARAELKKRWGTMQKVQSSKSRAEKIVDDILLDFETKERLANGRGNAILVSSSIYQACKFFEMFSQTSLKGKMAIVTSYIPSPSNISKEDAGAGQNEALRQYEIYRQMLADFFDESADTAMYRVEEFEKKVKNTFVKDPGQMRLLIVVDKLLTGFDAPSATYLYIDKHMKDHGLFQAICRVNRLDGDDKEYGYIIDYRDLFKSVEGAVHEYTAGALEGFDKEDVAGLLEDRLERGRQKLEETLEQLRALCEPVGPDRTTLAYQRYFCADDTTDRGALKKNEPKRVELYKAVTATVRAYGVMANEMPEAGFSEQEAKKILAEVRHYEQVRQEVKLGAGENIDYKQFDADMRYLLDTYIRADDSETVTTFDDRGLLDIIAELGAAGAIEKMPSGIKKNPQAAAETIENNTRKTIIDERPINPKYYDKMSELLDALIDQRRHNAIDYRQYLEQLTDLARRIKAPEATRSYPSSIDSAAKRAFYDNTNENEDVALAIDTAIKDIRKDSWRGNKVKEREVRNAIEGAVKTLGADLNVDELLELAKNHDEY